MNTNEMLQAIWDSNRNTDEANEEITELVSNLRMQLQGAQRTIDKLGDARYAVIDNNMKAS